MPSEQDLTVKINVGPHVSITERSEKLVCTRCDFLKHNLIRSGRDPQWECLCLHPRAKEVAQAMPGADRCWSTNGAPGCWIGEQPDTPQWCPLLKQNLDKPSAPSAYVPVEDAMRTASVMREKFTLSDPPYEEPRKKFCLSCGATHYKEICPECGSDAQDDL